jgi:uncharacterized protein YktA (UPF0223 family)
MAEQTHTVELTLEVLEDVLAFINSAQIYHTEKVEELSKLLGVYDMSEHTISRCRGNEILADRARQRWIEFYQIVKQARHAGKGGAA